MQRFVFLVTFVIISVPWVVVGQPCPPVDVNLSVADQAQTWWMVLLDFLVRLSAPLLTTVLGVLGAWFVRKLTRKWDTEKQEAICRLTDNLITAGVAFAEEQARKVLRVENVKTESADKLQAAINFVQTQLDQSGLPNIATLELTNLIESKLHQERTKPDGVVLSETTER